MKVFIVASEEYGDTVGGVFYKHSLALERSEELNQEYDWDSWNVEEWTVK